MDAYLDGIRSKLCRAVESIEGLNHEVAKFLRDNYRIAGRPNVESHKCSFAAFGESGLPPRFAVLIGEIVHHLRSALDHLITQLAAIGDGGGNPFVLEFPICRTHETFKASCERGKIKGVSADAAALIERLQP